MGKRKSSKKEDSGDFEKIKSLQEMIATAERTITSAKQMLAQLQSGSISAAEQQRRAPSLSAEGQVIHGTFDGQIMIGDDGKQYPVPANYASKSKLIEGDMLKLTITLDGNFVYKQIGPTERKLLIGICRKDDRGNFVISANGNNYKILLAAATYFKIEPGDEVTIVVPRDRQAVWAAVENIVRKASELQNDPSFSTISDMAEDISTSRSEEDDTYAAAPSAVERLKKEIEEERRKAGNSSLVEEWVPDIEQLKKEAGQPAEIGHEEV